MWDSAAAMQTLTLVEADEDAEEEEELEHLVPAELSWRENQHLFKHPLKSHTISARKLKKWFHKHAPQYAWPLFLHFL